MSEPQGGYAFPVGDNSCGPMNAGMGLRDYFAAHAPEHCSIYLVRWEFPEPKPEKPQGVDYHRRGGSADTDRLADLTSAYERAMSEWQDRRNRAQSAAARYAYADAMLEARGE